MIMGLDLTALCAGAVVALAATGLGYMMRMISHAILPWREPVAMAVVISQVGVLFLAMFLPEHPLMITLMGDFFVMLAVLFDAGYFLGFLMAKPNDVIYVDLPTEGGGAEVAPLVHYTYCGQQYMMPQRFGAVCKGLIGIRYPLDARLAEINQQREIYATNGLLAVTVYAAAASAHIVENYAVPWGRIGTKRVREGGYRGRVISEEPRYLIHSQVARHTIYFSQMTLDDPMNFWRKIDLYLDALADAAESRQYATRLEIQLRKASYEAAADLIAGIFNLTTDAPDYEAELRAAIAEERDLRTDKARRATDGPVATAAAVRGTE